MKTNFEKVTENCVGMFQQMRITLRVFKGKNNNRNSRVIFIRRISLLEWDIQIHKLGFGLSSTSGNVRRW